MFNRIKLLIFFINFFSRNSRMAILGIFNWEFINILRERENPEKEWFKMWWLGFRPWFGRCGSAEGSRRWCPWCTRVDSPKPKKLSRLNSVDVQTSVCIMNNQNNGVSSTNSLSNTYIFATWWFKPFIF